jgi:hypothetical protein
MPGDRSRTGTRRIRKAVALSPVLIKDFGAVFGGDPPSPTDGRSRIIELTDEGKRLHAKADPLWREAQRQFEHLNGAEKVVALRRGLREMAVGDGATTSEQSPFGAAQ